jgi:hypothetical protein
VSSNTTESDIFRALAKKVDAFAAANGNIAFKVPGKDFPRPSNTKHLIVDYLPARTERFGINSDSSDEHVGILQISVYWPEDQGIVAPLGLAGTVVNFFKKDTIMEHNGVTLKVSNTPWIAPPLPEPGWVQIPVNVPYQTFTEG